MCASCSALFPLHGPLGTHRLEFYIFLGERVSEFNFEASAGITGSIIRDRPFIVGITESNPMRIAIKTDNGFSNGDKYTVCICFGTFIHVEAQMRVQPSSEMENIKYATDDNSLI